MPEPMRHWVYLANLLEAAEVASGVRPSIEGIPPPGTQLGWSGSGDIMQVQAPLSGQRLAFYVTGVSDYPDPSTWSRDTLGHFLQQVGVDHVGWYARLASLFERTVGTIVSTIDLWPVIVRGTSEGNEMRWIKSSVRGTLNAVEDFQFGVNWGKPGADPDPTEDELAIIGVDMALKLKNALNATDAVMGGAALTQLYASDIKFTEVGVALCTITDATDKDGKGGNLSQAYETHWERINGTPGIVGNGSAISLPFEVSTCVTLHSEHRGPSGRGRLYMPPPKVAAIQAGGVFETNSATAAGIIIKKWFDAVKISEDLVPVIVSKRRLILNEVTQITVGIVPDSQRRRRWHQLEAPILVWQKP